MMGQIRCEAEADGTVRMGEGLAYMRIPIPCSRSATRWLVYLSTTNSGWTIRIALLMSPSQASQG